MQLLAKKPEMYMFRFFRNRSFIPCLHSKLCNNIEQYNCPFWDVRMKLALRKVEKGFKMALHSNFNFHRVQVPLLQALAKLGL